MKDIFLLQFYYNRWEIFAMAVHEDPTLAFQQENVADPSA